MLLKMGKKDGRSIDPGGNQDWILWDGNQVLDECNCLEHCVLHDEFTVDVIEYWLDY